MSNSKSSGQWSQKNLFATVALLSVGIGAVALVLGNEEQIAAFFKDIPLPPHVNKPIATFKEFFPFYLKEHSDLTNRRLHVSGKPRPRSDPL